MIFNNALLLVLLVLAVAAGWTLGRGGLRISGADRSQLPSQYYRGFNFLLDGEEEDAVDAFTEALAVNEETLDTHIALGSVLRKRGEVDRAIRIHQNLLTRPHLTRVQLHQSHLELARDFIAAGIYDRAEQLLIDLVAESLDFGATAQRHLLEVYEAQRDWPAAVAIAEALITVAEREGAAAAGHGQSVHQLRCQYLCEQADAVLERGDSAQASRLFELALRDTEEDLRARMGLSRMSLLNGEIERALHHFEFIMASVRTCTPELLKLLEDICAQQGGADSHLRCLRRYYEQQPCSLLALELGSVLESVQGKDSAETFLRETLRQHPSVSVAASLMLNGEQEAESSPERGVLQHLIGADQGYRCGHCGFTGSTRHWRCPGCRHWDSNHYLGAAGDSVDG
ncbi:MAG: tetratricopeptide repeat protein [Luminiphilus sp.]|nr:tetratricopeptide repeat protein [Luminiphilus sp.]